MLETEDYGGNAARGRVNVITLVDAAGRLRPGPAGRHARCVGRASRIANRGIARDGTSIYSLGGRRAQVLAWDARK